MNKEFIPYEQALSLKELEFDKECLAYYFTTNGENWEFATDSEFDVINETLNIGQNFIISAPLYQQAFRWFRENHGLHSNIGFDSWHTNQYMIDIVKEGDKAFHYDDPTLYKTYEEAELACLNKLIELVKDKIDEKVKG